MQGQRHCLFCGSLRSEPIENHKPDCQYRLTIQNSPSYPWHSTESDKRPLTEGSTKSNVKEQMPSARPPAPPAPVPPQRVEPHPNLVQTKNEEIVADIRNKLCSAYSYIQIGDVPMLAEMKESARLQALANFEYLIEKLKEIQ